MFIALRLDGFMLLAAAAVLVLVAQSFWSYAWRVPLFAIAFFNFAMSIHLLGGVRFSPYLSWVWLRLAADAMTFAILAVFLFARDHEILKAAMRKPRNRGRFFHMPHFF